MPTEPEVFLKSMLSLTGPFDPISRGPNRGVKLDWETELAIVVGREVQDITAEEAAGYIFGYVCLNDVSDRSTQVDAQKQIHLVRAKSRPTYCPIGPYLTTGINPMDLDVAYFSRHIRMVPGDILATGTPSGVGLAKNRFMAVGDILECGITNLGAQRHEIVA